MTIIGSQCRAIRAAIEEERKMADAVIVSTARTPIGKAFRGIFNDTHGADMGAHVIKHAAERAKVELAEVEDVILGCAAPEGTTGSNVARVSAMRAGAPVSVSGVTVNRFCSSGLQTISMAAQRVLVDKVPVMIAGGLESVSLVQGPPGGNKNSQEVSKKTVKLTKDEGNRPDTNLEGLAKLQPVMGPDKWITAGNASQLSDGASAAVIMSDAEAAKRGLKPLGIYKGLVVAGCEADEVGIGPVYALPKLLKRFGLKMHDIDPWTPNQAFA